MAKRYVDVNVFVYWLCGHPSFGERAKNWIERIEKEGNYITSVLTIYETIIIVAGLTDKSLRDGEFVKTVIKSFTGLKGLKIESFIKEDFAQALDIMSNFGLDFEDSLHLAVAMKKNVTEIISNDKDFDKTGVKRFF